MPRILAGAAMALLLAGAAAAQDDSAVPDGPPPRDDMVLTDGVETAEQMDARLETLFGVSQPFSDAFVAIRGAISTGDAQTLAQWVAYPFRVTYGDQELVIETPEDFVANYNEIVTEDIVEAVRVQEYERLFANADGVMFGEGQVWMTLICADLSCAESEVRVVSIQSTLPSGEPGE